MDSPLQQDASNTSHDGPRATAAEDQKNFAFSPVVTLNVGTDRTQYFVHKDLLVMKSDFFRACLSCGMVESQMNEVTLPDDTGEHFDIIVRYLYTGDLGSLEIFRRGNRTRGSSNATKEDIKRVHSLALDLYHTATKYSVPELQNSVIDCLYDWYYDHRVYPGTVKWACETVGIADPLTIFLQDALISDMKKYPCAYSPKCCVAVIAEEEKEEAGDSERALTDLLTNTDISVALLRKSTQECAPQHFIESKKNPCSYHVHKPGHDCTPIKNRTSRSVMWEDS